MKEKTVPKHVVSTRLLSISVGYLSFFKFTSFFRPPLFTYSAREGKKEKRQDPLPLGRVLYIRTQFSVQGSKMKKIAMIGGRRRKVEDAGRFVSLSGSEMLMCSVSLSLLSS